MEFTLGKCKKKHRKHAHVIHISSENSLSSNSETYFPPFKCLIKKKKGTNHSKHDYLTKLYERKKLKEKSLSKKMKTPFDRKINRTCWPIELSRVSKIKKKPHEKRREKPTHKSLTQKKFSNPTFISLDKECRLKSPQITVSDLEFLDDGSFNNINQYINRNNYLFEHAMPQTLMDVLQEPKNLKTGVTINMIIEKLRTLNMDSKPTLQQLKQEVKQKLLCAIKMGLVIENDGYYRMADNFQSNKFSKEKVKALWELWREKMRKIN